MRSGTFDMPAFWAILMWLAFDIWGAAAGGSRIGHTAHIAGLAVGVAVAIALLKLRLVEMDEDERSILDLLAPATKKPHATPAVTPRSRSSAAPSANRTGRPTVGLPAPSDASTGHRRGPAPTPKDEPIPLAEEPTEKREKRSY